MAKIWGQLENAQLENKASDYSAGPVGRLWWNTSVSKVAVDDGTNVRYLLRNDSHAVIGTNGTANSNIRFHRGAAGVLQFVTGGDATAEGTLSTSLNQISGRVENYATGSLPAAGNAGRIFWDTSLSLPKWDDGAVIQTGVLLAATQTFTNKTFDTNTNTFKSTGANAGTALISDGSANTAWLPVSSPEDTVNYTITTSVATNALTINLKTLSGGNPSSTDPVYIAFRNATAATGTYTVVAATASTSLVVSSGATLGTASATNYFLYLYAINNAGTVELAITASRQFDEGSVLSTTIMSSGSTSRTTLYSTTARTGVAVRLIARFLVNETTAGTWTATPTEISLNPSNKSVALTSEIRLNTNGGFGSGNTAILYWSNVDVNNGTDITYTSSTTNGDSFKINTLGMYMFSYTLDVSAASNNFGFSLNSAQLSTDIQNITAGNRLKEVDISGAEQIYEVTWFGRLTPGDIIRCHTRTGLTVGGNNARTNFQAIKIGD